MPWKRYGFNRLYVNTHSGDRVGWFDLDKNQAVLEREELRYEFEHVLRANGVGTHAATEATSTVEIQGAVRAEREPQVAAVSPSAPTAIPPLNVTVPPLSASTVPVTESVECSWIDLARNQPGQSVRKQAASLRQAAPMRTLVARVVGKHTDERAFRVGAEGEKKVARRLARLPESWKVLHSVPIGSRGSDIDHVIVGSVGVFTVNTKHHPEANIWVRGDTFKVDRRNQPYVRNARFEAKRASGMLSAATGLPISVTGVIAVVGARGGFIVKAQPADGVVHVVGRKNLVKWLLGHGSIFSPEQVSIVFDQARRSTTWFDDC